MAAAKTWHGLVGRHYEGIQVSVAKHTGGGLGRTAFWIRHGGHLRRRTSLAGDVLCDIRVPGRNLSELRFPRQAGILAWLHHRQRPDRHDSRRLADRQAVGYLGPPQNVVRAGDPLLRLRRLERLRVGLVVVRDRQVHRRSGRRRIVGRRADLHRGNLPGGQSRSPGRPIPIQHRIRHPLWPSCPTTSSAH